MTNHKLISFEPTPEMVEAAEKAYMPFGDMDLAIRMAILTAPAERQPSADSLAPVPDEAFTAEFAVWWDEHGQFCRAGGGTYERTFAFEAWRHLYPQLMNLQMAAADQQSDVALLVEALEPFAKCADELDGYPADGIEPSDDNEWAKFRLLVSDYRRARTAIAAYRKGGEV